jgi:K+-transporting ATPase KdpF subunit
MCLPQVNWLILDERQRTHFATRSSGRQKGEPRERFHFYFSDDRLLPGRDWLLARLRTAEVRRRFSMLENVVLILISLLLFGYLMYALLKPENF